MTGNTFLYIGCKCQTLKVKFKCLDTTGFGDYDGNYSGSSKFLAEYVFYWGTP